MNIKKFTFEIDSAGDFEVVKFTVKAATREDADKFVLLINPSARLVNIEETDVVLKFGL